MTRNIKKEPGYLTGQLLIATPQIGESCFSKSLIYICVHNQEGAMGIIVNHTVRGIESNDLLGQLGIETHKDIIQFPIHFGGPVESSTGFILHSSDHLYSDTLVRQDGFALTSNLEVVEQMIRGEGPDHSMFALGYAGWQPGQLEAEIAENSWINLPATKELVFEVDDKKKWHKACDSLGFNPYMLSDTAGNA